MDDPGPTRAEMLASDIAAYFAAVIDCGSIDGPCDLASPTLYTMASNLAQLAAEAILAPLPKPYNLDGHKRNSAYQDNWEAVYDTWLGRATQHALQAGVLGGREG